MSPASSLHFHLPLLKSRFSLFLSHRIRYATTRRRRHNHHHRNLQKHCYFMFLLVTSQPFGRIGCVNHKVSEMKPLNQYKYSVFRVYKSQFQSCLHLIIIQSNNLSVLTKVESQRRKNNKKNTPTKNHQTNINTLSKLN